MPFTKGQSGNPKGREVGTRNKHVVSDLVSQNREIKAQLSRTESLQIEFIKTIAAGNCPPFATVEQALGAMIF